MDNNIFDLYAKRHSFYNITNDCPLTAEEIENLVQKSLELYPSPFNSQSARVMVLFGKNHKNLWGITAETMLRIVQSVPSPKAEPIKQWLARVGYERMKETADPSLSIDRARENWQKLGHSEKWIQQRMMGQETRNKLTDYWKEHEITKDEEYAILTNIIHQEWSGLSVKEHKQLKGLKSQNLCDHMSEAELPV